LEEAEFEIFTDNQVSKHFLTKSTLSRREARWSEILGNYGIFPITMKPGKVHVLGDVLSRAPHVMNSSDETSAVVNTTEIPRFDRSDIVRNYEADQFCGPIVRPMRDEFSDTEQGRRQMERMLPHFSKASDRCILYQGCGTLEYLTRARGEREGETVRITEGSVKKPRLGCLYLRESEHASAAVR
jgi:hypothetical protein